MCKVEIHQKVKDSMTDVDRWLALGNAAADRSARAANVQRPSGNLGTS